MLYNTDTAAQLADFLLQIKAIKLQPSKPFVWASGWKSPIYCDNRLTLSYPKVRTFIRQELAKAIADKFEKPDVIAGVATGGIAHGALVAQELGLPFIYVRSAPKGHGMENLVEGKIEPGQTVVVVEDLISTGQSSIKVVKALRDAGCIVKGLVSIFDYGFDVAVAQFKEDKCPFYSLSNYDSLLDQAVKNKYVALEEIDQLKSWRDNPSSWGATLKIA
ncbi:MAG TPA: orotate phosphoribosyltransferase [Flavobacteriales bacterium]|jgi:orotate phosphoribosyltransferase|nr:orotate phosphoribosyltransferase [Flavobacteriales bacterium]